jgi:general secretion pathway protein G
LGKTLDPANGVSNFKEKGGFTTVTQRWFEKHRELQARRAEEGFDGFTLIELLIVIVVLGILAAVVIFALGGVTGQSKQAACNADAKTVEVAVEAYHSFPGNTNNAWPGSYSDLTNPTFTNQAFLRQVPGTGNGYQIILGANGLVNVKVGATTKDYDSTNLCNTLT